ncbi:MAG: flavodoxin-dependent (E)-4-hydroxy-3-methylbut-2-enyl-diphosphate synthase [Bacilli bacterium]|nr:flavodoxin-dependent (E)-4-hydroxy-3-methylbut-2-enyl-diphosphate synthase [Bacilli bacterium]
MKRNQTLKIKVGRLTLGGNNRVLIQSMCNIKTSKVNEVSRQINECAKLGADLMRVSVLDANDAKAIKEIKKKIKIPLIADIHFDYRLAIDAINNGADAIRINPGNIGSIDKIKKVVSLAKKKNIPIRIGVNSGSLDKSISDKVSAINLVKSAKKHVAILEKLGFKNIVISLKGSNVRDTTEAYTLASKTFKYPLHLGITEAGPSEIGISRSVAALAPLLLNGIGNTIRLSLSDEPQKEVIACKKLLHDVGLYPNYPTLISCPTCGRTQVNLIPLANKVLRYLEDNNINKKVAVMGCVVNGPGEAKECDIGLAGGKNEWVLFKKGKVVKKIKESDAFKVLIQELKKI